MSKRGKVIYTAIASRESYLADGCIERASTVRPERGREGSLRGQSKARVAWRILGDCGCGDGELCPLCEWAVSCCTPVRLWGDCAPGYAIGDGSDEAMAAWVRGGS